ncbi:MAG TPA: tetratricopeptide repeat protein, partial [Pseudonocardiaceae bacterium]
LFGLLALHPGTDFELRGAAALAGADRLPTERLLAGLHDAHLLAQQPNERYQCHDLLRTFAKSMALATIPPAEQHAALHRLLDLNLYATDLVDRVLAPQRHRPTWTLERLPAELPVFDKDSGLEWIRAEWPNLVALCRLAGTTGFPAHCWQLAFALRGFFFLTKLWDPWITAAEYAVRAAEQTGDRWAQATIANGLGLARTEQGDLDGAALHYGRALDLFQAVGDEYGIHTARNNLAWPDYYRGDHAAALDGMAAAADFYRRNGLDRNAAITLRGLSLVEAALGRYTEALRDNSAAIVVFGRLDLDLDTAMAFNCRGWIHYLAGEQDAAADDYREALARSLRCRSAFEAARAETGLGNVAAALGREQEARLHWDRAAERHPRLDPVVVSEARIRAAAGGGLS